MRSSSFSILRFHSAVRQLKMRRTAASLCPSAVIVMVPLRVPSALMVLLPVMRT